jgi:hypothetical protein
MASGQHNPPEQVVPGPQAFPQPPQLPVSTYGSTQIKPPSESYRGHVIHPK